MAQKLDIQTMIFKLEQFWASKGCMIMPSYDENKGAGTMSPYTFLRAVGPEPWKACYVEPSRRPADGRYGDNPNRLFQHHQFQVVLKPAPLEIQQYYLDSLKVLGIEPLEHDIRFVEDNWENPSMAVPVLAGKSGWTGWKFPNLPTSKLSANWTSSQPWAKSLTGLNGWLPTSRTLTQSLTWNGATASFTGTFSRNLNTNTSKYAFEESDQKQLLEFFDTYERIASAFWARTWFTRLTTTS